jgi:alpha-tubulin suppressor-like RCC1 family protein
MCWGAGHRGLFGDEGVGARRFVAKPKAVPGLENLSCVGVGPKYTCTCHASGKVSCWGRNEWGQLGRGDKKGRTEPEVVPGLENVTSLAVGSDHVCALSRDGVVHCWGKNHRGQIGDGEKGLDATRLSPVRIDLGEP